MRIGVLVVEDDPDFSNALREYFALDPTWGAPYLARDGAEALALVEGGVVPELVLLDLELPKVHGREVLSHLRADPRFRRTAVVVTGAHGEPGRERDQFLPGEVWLPKPFQMDELATAVSLAISRSVEMVSAA